MGPDLKAGFAIARSRRGIWRILDKAIKEKVMKCPTSFILILGSMLFLTATVWAQETTGAAESAEKLRSQLIDVQDREALLRIRAQQLEDELKPDNIERSLAGIGSTKPEELREYRRRQLTIERDGVIAQLKILETSRSRLETAVIAAESRAYQESADPKPPIQMTRSDSLIAPTGLSVVSLGLLMMVGIAVMILIGCRIQT